MDYRVSINLFVFLSIYILSAEVLTNCLRDVFYLFFFKYLIEK